MLNFSDMQGFSFRGGSTQKPKIRMAGDYMADFTKSNSTADTPNTSAANNGIESNKNDLINSFYMDYSSFNTPVKNDQPSSSNNTSQTSTSSGSRTPEDSTSVVSTPSTDSSKKQMYSITDIYNKYAKMDQGQTGSVADKNQGSIAMYYKGQEEIKRLGRAGQLLDKHGEVVPASAF